MSEFVPRRVAAVIPPRSWEREEEDIAATAAWLMSTEGLDQQCVREWIAFLANHYAVFRAILSLFPRKNPGREGKKDRHCFATSAEEMLAISNQLFILHSHGVNGIVLECGCFKGYSSCCLSLACRRLGYPFVIADSFAGLPPDDDDVGTTKYYQVGDFAGSRQEVEQNLRTFGDITSVEFLEGWYSETLRGWDRPLALLWMDVDLASSTRDLLEPCLPLLDPRGLIFSHEFSAACLHDGKIVEQNGPAGAIAPIIQKQDADYRAAFLWDCLGIVGRRTSLGFQSYKLLDELIPWLSRIGEPACAPAALPETSPVYEGVHDPGDGRTIRGWAWDSSRPDSPLEVAILDGDRPLATVTADRFRPDLLRAGKGNGRHGFIYPIPAELIDGCKHLVVVRIASTNVDLSGTPRSIEPEVLK
jgi:Macrocin-O-methyltransferase (TylF)